ncbi:MAG: hypothetical protein Q9170_004452, partial [Blastenia crenularia]
SLLPEKGNIKIPPPDYTKLLRTQLVLNLIHAIPEGSPASAKIHSLIIFNCHYPDRLNMRDIKVDVINTAEQISDLVDWLVFRHAPPVPHSPTMYIDLEGVNLCREGSISILTLMIDTGTPTNRVCLIDVHSLDAKAFNTAGVQSKTIKDILQDDNIPKVFFDVRNDSDALFAQFGVALQGVEDVQLMESATRKTTGARKFLNGLSKCIEQNMLFSPHGFDRASWTAAKKKGERLFKAEYGGSYEVFNQRPIPEEIISYCVGDVVCLPELRVRFWKGAYSWQHLVDEETKKRVAASQKPGYQPHGRDRAMAPWSENQNKDLDTWNYVSPPCDYFGEDWMDEDWHDDFDNDYEDWTRADWQGPPS